MTILHTLFLAAEETEFDPDSVTPGVEGFIFTGLLAALVISLGFLLVHRLRRNAYRAEVREEIAEELASAEGTADAAGAADAAGIAGSTQQATGQSAEQAADQTPASGN